MGHKSDTGSVLLAPVNQQDSITAQLNNGVRGLMLDMYEFENDIWLLWCWDLSSRFMVVERCWSVVCKRANEKSEDNQDANLSPSSPPTDLELADVFVERKQRFVI